MSNVKERIIGAVTIMSEEEAEKVYARPGRGRRRCA